MANERDVEAAAFAKQSKLFELLDDAGRKRMLEAAVSVRFGVGETIVCEGDTGDAMFVIRSGMVRVTAEALDGERQVATLGPGAVFGEIAVIGHEQRTATVRAEGEVELWRFDVAAIDAILADYPTVRELLARLGLRRSELTLEKLLESDTVITDDEDPGTS
ncbi:MAG: cyclic nucleotide-binding domain-containing protein [Deltaproteobacteria bacterium]|nr:cyclic nucleotide-binding domain-containing protein [Deltaproteobacteria bacterium]